MSQRNKMSLLLSNMDKRGYQAFCKMNTQSTSKLNTQRNNSQSYLIDNRPCNEIRTRYPFGLTEQRFKWQNLDNPNRPINNILEIRKQKKAIHKDDCFDGGFNGFFNKPNPSRQKRMNASQEQTNKQTYSLVSRRVIQPELDWDKKDYEYKQGKRYYGGKNKSNSICLKKYQAGRIETLIKKTPDSFPVTTGKKRLASQSFDRESINIFSDEFNNIVPSVKPAKRQYF